MTGSLEARIKITDTIGIVPFIDVGTVSDSTFPGFPISAPAPAPEYDMQRLSARCGLILPCR